MKKVFVQCSLALLLLAGFTVQSCKNKTANTDTTNTNTTTVDTTTTAAPVTVSNDDALRTGVTDATKDYPGVTATVNNGVITLTGEIQRDRLPNLMQALNNLHPQKIDNNLTVK
jgi:hypothetical protein